MPLKGPSELPSFPHDHIHPASCGPTRTSPHRIDVTDQGVRFELREHMNRGNSRVGQGSEHKIDDPVPEREMQGRFRLLLGQRPKPCPFTAGKDKRQNVDASHM